MAPSRYNEKGLLQLGEVLFIILVILVVLDYLDLLDCLELLTFFYLIIILRVVPSLMRTMLMPLTGASRRTPLRL